MKTLALNDDWDIYIGNDSNIAVKDGNERLAQDVASSVMVWKNELPFDMQRGVNYAQMDEMRNTLQAEMNKQVVLVDGVLDSTIAFEKLENRTLYPIIYVTNEENETITVGA